MWRLKRRENYNALPHVHLANAVTMHSFKTTEDNGPTILDHISTIKFKDISMINYEIPVCHKKASFVSHYI